MKHQALVSIDFEAEDVYAEATVRRRLDALLDEIRDDFPSVELTIRRRRSARTPRSGPPAPLSGDFEVVGVRYAP